MTIISVRVQPCAGRHMALCIIREAGAAPADCVCCGSEMAELLLNIKNITCCGMEDIYGKIKDSCGG